jgi:hypothetical protein
MIAKYLKNGKQYVKRTSWERTCKKKDLM